MSIRILFIGNDGRGNAIAEALENSQHRVLIFSYMEKLHPGIETLSYDYEIGGYDDVVKIVAFAKRMGDIDFAIISPEKPLLYGVTDELEAAGIPCVAPKKAAAQIETSKSFARKLLNKYSLIGNPRYKIFESLDLSGMKKFMESLDQVVIKPDGLTGGKGVKVQGDHFVTKGEAMEICAAILKTHPRVIIEEKLEGEEFSLQCLCDGKTVVATPPVQDHKRRFADDKGPNTGSMGSYSCANHLLPFLNVHDLENAVMLMQYVALAIKAETGVAYRGILYGGFMVTKHGLKLIEFNARFGDPEAINVLPLLETDFVNVCLAIISGRLDKLEISFQKKATVCLYLVPRAYALDLPEGHPDLASNSAKIEFGNLGGAKLFFSSVEKRADGVYTTPSRTVAVLGIGCNLAEAKRVADRAALAITGPVDYREDIGTEELVRRRVEHMNKLRGE